MSYYPDEPSRSNFGPFLFVAMISASVALFFLFTWKKLKEREEPSAGTEEIASGEAGSKEGGSLEAVAGPPDDRVEKTSEVYRGLVQRLEAGDWDGISELYGGDEFSQQAAHDSALLFRALGERLGYRPLPGGALPVEETSDGPIYALPLRSQRVFEDRATPDQKVFLQMAKFGEDWKISHVRFPDTLKLSAIQAVTDGVTVEAVTEAKSGGAGGAVAPAAVVRPGELPDLAAGPGVPAGAASAFLQAVIDLDYEKARELVEIDRVQGEKIAALCFVFEEGGFRPAAKDPLVVTASQDDASWAIAKVFSESWGKHAEFGLEMEASESGKWLVVGINFSSLLSTYAESSAASDVAFTPLVDSPEGGQSLALFFGYDEAELHPRAERQLRIVADMLKKDSSKKVRVTGHADSQGTEDYNQTLSRKRAGLVRSHLAALGVDPSQVVTAAAGEKLPLRPNLKEDGSDDPEGRAHNRRAEMYLDF